MDDVVHIWPQIMIFLNVPHKTTLLATSFKYKHLQIANVASIIHIFIILALLISEFSERVDDNTKYDIEADDIHNDLERHVVD